MAELKLMREGNTEFFVPADLRLENRGPGKKLRYGFYNPAMEESRDISVAVVQVLVNEFDREIDVLDGLASIGARGLRIANEVEGNFNVVLNDWSKEAIEIAKKSIEHNNLPNIKTRCEDLNVLLCKERFHYIDIDPFGSPVPYINIAVRSVLPDGILAVTATDTATLCGVYRKTCIRRYSSKPLRTWSMHEIGLRILLGYIIREGARFDKALYPIFSYSKNYYMRAYFKAKKGAKKADELVKNVDTLKTYDFDLREKEVGPLWIGNLHDKGFLVSLRDVIRKKSFRKKRDIEKLVDRCLDEIDMPPLFYDINALASYFKRSPPKIFRMMKVLEKEGYRVSRTHFRDTSFKTDAPLDEVIKVFNDLTI